MKTNKVGIGFTAIVAIFLAMATAAYACTVTAAQPFHDFEVTPAVATAGTLVTAEGYCTVNFDGCSLQTVGPNSITFGISGPCSFVPGAANPCPTSPGGHTHTSPCTSTSGFGTGTQTREDLPQNVKVHVVTMGLTSTAGLGSGTYAVCSSFEPGLLWNYLTVV